MGEVGDTLEYSFGGRDWVIIVFDMFNIAFYIKNSSKSHRRYEFFSLRTKEVNNVIDYTG